MADSYDLSKLDPDSFEHLANFLALKVLGPGHTGFAPGPDGGRDGYFEGEAPYPSEAEHWSGRWYIQAKFHKPHLSTQPQKWLIEKVREELEEFTKRNSRRIWPDNWILVTNIDPSGTPETGSFDQCRAMLELERPELAPRFHIWGGRKVLDLLQSNPDVAAHYKHFITPGHVLTALLSQFEDAQASIADIVRVLLVDQLEEQQYTKLEQAGSAADSRPGIHRLFVDLPFRSPAHKFTGMGARLLATASAETHDARVRGTDSAAWRWWRTHPRRARVWFVKGGQGHGKSTLGQYLCQVNRAALILESSDLALTLQQRDLATTIRTAAQGAELWPVAARVPFAIELKDFAKWFGEQSEGSPRGVLTYLADRLTAATEQPVLVGTLRRAFRQGRWMFVFDGLDEVPSDVKDSVAAEVKGFIDRVLVACSCDAFSICTSRPQGYSGQFNDLEAADAELIPLTPDQALACATPVLEYDRSREEGRRAVATLTEALAADSIRAVMTTPLQAHIMAVVVRDGGPPPERKWQLFSNFYAVIKRREATRKLPKPRLAGLLLRGDKLLKALHNRLGFELHWRAERSDGAQTSLDRGQLRILVHEVVSEFQDREIDETVDTLMEATTERLVLVSTPESGDKVRFDIRPLQEFFAAEYIYERVNSSRLADRLKVVAGDSHWREVMHFLLSALIDNNRQSEIPVAIEAVARLNFGPDEDSPRRMVHRRVALGALIAADLLAEGVVEEEREARQQLRRCLEPLLGVTDAKLFGSFERVVTRYSQSWLQELVFDCLADLSESEKIGAAYAAARLFDETHDRCAEVALRVEATSMGFKGCLFEMLHPRPFLEEDVAPLPRWVRRLAFQAIVEPEWKLLGCNGLSAAVQIAGAKEEDIEEIALELGLAPDLAALCPAIFAGEREQSATPDAVLERGMWMVEFHRSKVAAILDKPEDQAAVRNAPGALSLLPRLLELAERRSVECMEQVIQCANGSVELLRSLPRGLQAFLPDEIKVALPGRPLTISWLYQPGYMPRYVGSLLKELSPERVAKSFADDPENSLQWYLGGFFGDAFQRFGETPEGRQAVVAACIEHPDIAATYPPRWGDLLRFGNDLGIDLRGVLVAGAGYCGEVYGVDTTVAPVELFMPKDAPLLVPLCRWVTETSPEFTAGAKNGVAQVGSLLLQWIPDAKQLLETMLNHPELLVRGAAAVLCLLHPECCAASRLVSQQVLRDSYVPHTTSWYVKAAAVALAKSIWDEDPAAIQTLGHILHAARLDFPARLAADPVFNIWRQHSKAPVHAYGAELF